MNSNAIFRDYERELCDEGLADAALFEGAAARLRAYRSGPWLTRKARAFVIGFLIAHAQTTRRLIAKFGPKGTDS